MNQENSFYNEAHLFVAALRVLTHQRRNLPPAVEDICGLLSFSAEWGAMMCRKLKQMGIVETAEDSHQVRVYVGDHRRLEEIPRQEQETESHFSRELEKFQQNKKAIGGKVEAIAAQLNKKKQDLFAELENRLKKEGKP